MPFALHIQRAQLADLREPATTPVYAADGQPIGLVIRRRSYRGKEDEKLFLSLTDR